MQIPEIKTSSAMIAAIRSAVRTTISDAVRLGLVWRLRPGTVGGSGVSNPLATPVVVDGDNAQLIARSWIGGVSSGQRVWCVFVPPAGAYVVGIIGASQTAPVMRTFTTSGTWTKPAGLSYIRLRMVGGGGAGGGAAATAAGQSSMGGGGGGGAAAEGIFQAADLPSTVTVTRGASGTGVIGAAGNAGGTSSFGAIASVSGGSGGQSRAASAVPHGVEGGDGGLVVSGTGMVEFRGDAGETGWGSNNGLGISGGGGSSHLGGGGRGRRTDAPGQGLVGGGGNRYGGGGGGAINSGGSAARAGSAGAAGIVIVEEHFG